MRTSMIGNQRRTAVAGRMTIPAFVLLALLAVSTPGRAYNVYYADLHSHTALSDGIGTPQEAYAYARDVANIDVLAITDHSTMMTSTEWTTLRNAATAATQTGVFVGLASQESGNLNDFGHLNIHDSPFLNTTSTENLLANYSFIQQMNAIGAFNHPNPTYGTFFNNLSYYPEYESAMKMIEIRNGQYSGDYAPQFHQALANGWKVGPCANQDNHEGQWGDQTNPAGRILLTAILADSLSRTQIVAALRARRFYAEEVFPASDRIELDFRVDGQPMGSFVTSGIVPVFTVWARSVNGTSLIGRVDLYRDGVVRDTRAILGTEINYEYREGLTDGESHYYYARITQLDGDHAWSSPVWVTALVDPAAVPPSAARGGLRLLGASPDPFSAATTIRLVADDGTNRVPAAALRLRVLDPAGRLVCTLSSPSQAGGAAWTWNGRDDAGRAVAPGVYFLRTEGPAGFTAGGRVVRVR